MKIVPKKILYRYYDSLIPAAFDAMKMSFFQGNFYCNAFLDLIQIRSEAYSGPCQISIIELLVKLVNIFLAVNYFRKKTSF